MKHVNFKLMKIIVALNFEASGDNFKNFVKKYIF